MVTVLCPNKLHLEKLLAQRKTSSGHHERVGHPLAVLVGALEPAFVPDRHLLKSNTAQATSGNLSLCGRDSSIRSRVLHAHQYLKSRSQLWQALAAFWGTNGAADNEHQLCKISRAQQMSRQGFMYRSARPLELCTTSAQ